MTNDKLKDRMMLSIPLEYKKRLQMKAVKENKTIARIIREWIDKDEKVTRFNGDYDNGVRK